MTYNVFSGTLNPTQSQSQSGRCQSVTVSSKFSYASDTVADYCAVVCFLDWLIDTGS